MSVKESVKKSVKTNCDYFFKKKLATTIIVGVLAIGVGVTAGVVVDKFILGETSVNYDSLKVNDYECDDAATYAKYESCKGSKNYDQHLKGYELVSIGFQNYSKYQNTQSLTYGLVDTAVQQIIRASSIKENGKYFEESISKSSMVEVATRTYQDENDNIALIRGSNVSSNGEIASWPNECVDYTREEYTTDFGKCPSEPLIYIVSDKTVASSKVTRDGTDYVVDLEMNNKYSVLKYVCQMKTVSNLKEKPSFSSVHLTFTLDENLLVKKLVSKESYFARIQSGLGSKCNAILEIYYHVDGTYKIPSLSENVIYSGGNV